MGLRFQRRVKLLPGLHLNLSLSGVGVSVGGRGAHFGVTASGQRYTSVGLPGTGLSKREYHKPVARWSRCDRCAPGHVHFPAWLTLVIVFVIVIAVIASKSSVEDYESRRPCERRRAIASDNRSHQTLPRRPMT